ncbi:MAG: hypothetical protein ACE5I1_02530 [bacterium]
MNTNTEVRLNRDSFLNIRKGTILNRLQCGQCRKQAFVENDENFSDIAKLRETSNWPAGEEYFIAHIAVGSISPDKVAA